MLLAMIISVMAIQIAMTQGIIQSSNKMFLYLNNGRLYVWGHNEDQIFKEWSRPIYPSPTMVSQDSSWIAIDGSSLGFVGLKKDGSIWGIGINKYGQFGGSKKDTVHYWRKLSTMQNWISIGISEKAVYGLNNVGEVWAMGSNIGDGTTMERIQWEQLIPYKKWAKIFIGEGACFLISSSNALYGYGGYTGNEIRSNSLYFDSIRIGSIADKIKDIKSTRNNTCVLWDNGSVSILGSNNYGQYGAGYEGGTIREILDNGSSNLLDFTRIALDKSTFVGVKKNGEVWGCGENICGNLGDGTDSNRNKLVQIKIVGKALDVYTFANNSIHVGSSSNNSCLNTNMQLNSHTTFIIDNDFNLISLGHNSRNECGDSAILFNFSFVKLPLRNIKKIKNINGCSFALDETGQLWHTGENEFNQKGDLGTVKNPTWLFRNFPYRNYVWSKCPEGDSIIDFDLTTQGVMVLKTDGWIWSWGRANYSDRLVFGGTVPRKVTTFNDWSKFSFNGGCHENYVTLLNRNKKMEILGNTPLMPKSQNYLSTYRFDDFEVGYNSIYAFINDSVWVWGKSHSNIGVDNVGDPLEPKLLNGKWRSIYSNTGATLRPGQNHQTFGINKEGHLLAWGYSHKGNIGTIDSIDGFIFAPKIVDSTQKWIQVTSNNGSSYGLTSTGAIFYWGINSLFRGLNEYKMISTTRPYNIRPILLDSSKEWIFINSSELGDVLFAIDTSKNVYAIGNSLLGVLGDNTKDHIVTPTVIQRGSNKFPVNLDYIPLVSECEEFQIKQDIKKGRYIINSSVNCDWKYVQVMDIMQRRIGESEVIYDNGDMYFESNNLRQSEICVVCLTDAYKRKRKCKKYVFN